MLLSTQHLRGRELSVWLYGYILAVLQPLLQTVQLLRIVPVGLGAVEASLLECYSLIGYFMRYQKCQLFLAHPSHGSFPSPDELYPPQMMSQLQQKVFANLLRHQLEKRSAYRLLRLKHCLLAIAYTQTSVVFITYLYVIVISLFLNVSLKLRLFSDIISV